MSTPSKDDLVENLYQIPCCTICLSQLNQDLTTLACGHCFHFICITQHFQYKGTCPNCQKRACLKQTRVLHFQPILNNKTSSHLRLFLSSLSLSERNQMELIFKELKIQSESAEKLKIQNHQLELQLKTKITHLQNMKEDINRKRNQIQILRKSNLQMNHESENLRILLKQSESSEAYLRVKLEKLENQLRDYQLFKKYKKAMNESSEQLLKIKSQMQSNDTPPSEMVRQFFQMCQLGKLQQGKNRQKLRDMQQKIDLQQEQNMKLKEQNQKLERDIRKLNVKIYEEKKKVQETESKYRKIKQRSIEVEQKEDYNVLSNTSRKIVKAETHNKIASSFINSNTIQQSLQNSVRKPTFGGSFKFGGLSFRKKEDTTKISNMK